MQLSDFINVLLQRKWIVILTTVVCVALVTVGSLLTEPVYSASATIRVPTAPNPLVDRADVLYAQRLMNTYTIIARSLPLLNQVIEDLDLALTARQLDGMIEAQPIEDTELFRIKVNSTDPAQAAAIANALANALIAETDAALRGAQSAPEAIQDQIAQVEQELTDLRTEYDAALLASPQDTALITELSRRVVIKQQTYETLLAQYDEARLVSTMRVNAIVLIEEAVPPTTPTTPRLSLNMALAGVLGLLGGVALVLIMHNLDSRLYTSSQIQPIVDLPILAEIHHVRRNGNKLINLEMAQREAYRRLRVNIFSLQKSSPLKIIVVTSAVPGEGKSTIVANLAVSVAQLRHTVLIIDCDLRHPCQHQLFDLPNEVGFSTVLKKKVSLSEAIQQTPYVGLNVLTSGPVPDNPTELLSSNYVANIMEELKPKYDVILLDTPALIPVIDAAVLAPLADGVIQIVRSGLSQEDATLTTLSQIHEVQANPIGVVLNDVPARVSKYHNIPLN